MKTRQPPAKSQSIIHNPLVRIVGVHATAVELLANAQQAGQRPVVIRSTPAGAATGDAEDYIQIDPALVTADCTENVDKHQSEAPVIGSGYAGFTPYQRQQLLQWLADPRQPAHAAYRQFYLAHLEVGLFDPEVADQVQAELRRLQATPSWQQHEGLARVSLLACWLAQDGAAICEWLATRPPTPACFGLLLGAQALLNTPLNAAQLAPILEGWRLVGRAPSSAMLALRLSSLATTLNQEPLHYALAQQAETARQPRPWRCLHRDLRLALPQLDLRSVLEPLLRDLLSMPVTTPTATGTSATPEDKAPTAGNTASNNAASSDAYEDDDEEAVEDVMPRPNGRQEDGWQHEGWQLVLEFGESRADTFAFVIKRAQQLPGYLPLMDENRQLVHRVYFRKSELRRFWSLWDHTQGWSSTKVFVNGKELRKWDIYPYSPHLK
ncbi:MAG: hypothetical protein R3C14_36275 [Caldilineaceae bacterium]